MKVYRLSYGNGGIFEEEALEMTSHRVIFSKCRVVKRRVMDEYSYHETRAVAKNEAIRYYKYKIRKAKNDIEFYSDTLKYFTGNKGD